LYYSQNNIEGITTIEDTIIGVLDDKLLDDTSRLLFKLVLFNLQCKNVEEIKIQIIKLLKEGNK
jgi:hypothetical protein